MGSRLSLFSRALTLSRVRATLRNLARLHEADIFLAANWAALGILYNTGQDCTAGSRVYVQDTVYDKFIQILVRKAKETVIADGFDESATIGPVVSDFSVLSLPSVLSCHAYAYELACLTAVSVDVCLGRNWHNSKYHSPSIEPSRHYQRQAFLPLSPV